MSMAPYIHIARDMSGLRVSGQHRCSLGHRLPRGDGRTDGIFAEWRLDGRVLSARNDRYGFQPLYYHSHGSSIALSPSVAALVAAGASRELDDTALAVYLRLGQFLGQDTPFRHIRSLPPDATLTWSDGELTVEGGHTPVRPLQGISRRDAGEMYRDLFRRSIERRLPSSDRFAVPLSGGRDSRHILFELCRQGRKPMLCVTAVHYPEDVRIAALVTNELGIEHAVASGFYDPFDAEMRKNELTSFGANDGTWALLLARSLAERRVEAIYDGIGGDVLSAGLFLTPELDGEFRRGDPVRVAERLLPDNEAVLEVLVAPAMLRRWSRERAIERMAVEVRKHLDAHNPVTSFMFWNRTRRKIAQTPYGTLSGPFTVYAPYLDHDVFDFLSALPTGLLMDHAFHTEVILMAYPEWAHLPFEQKGIDARDRALEHVAFAHRFSRVAGFAPRAGWLRQPAFSARLLASRMSKKFAATSDWYFRPALWLFQLQRLIGDAAGIQGWPAGTSGR